MPIAQDLTITEAQARAGVEAGEVLPSRQQRPSRKKENGIPPRETREAFEARERFIKKRKDIPVIVPEEEVVTIEERTIDVGIKTDKPQKIIDTDDVRKLQKDNPKLFNTLKNEGIDEFNKAVDEFNRAAKLAFNLQQFEAQQTRKRFFRLNQQLPDGQFVAKDDLAQLKVDSPEIHKALTESGFDVADKIIIRQKATFEKNQLAISMLEKYTDKKGGVDGAEYLKDNPGDIFTLKNAGFDKGTIKTWQDFNNQQQKQQAELEKVSLPKVIWQMLTPWEEVKGETFGAYTLKRFTGKEELESQQALKAKHDAYEKSPLWAKILFGQEVIKNPKTGEYYRLLLGEPPMITPAGKAVQTAKSARTLTKTIEINWNKLKGAVKKPRIDWDEIVKAIKSGEVRDAQQAAKWARKPGSQAAATTEVTIEEIAAAQRRLEAIERIAVEAAAESRVASTIDIRRRIFGGVTKAKLDKLVADWEKMKANRGFAQIIASGFAANALAVKPAEMANLLAKMTPNQAQKILEQADAVIQSPVESEALTRPQIKQLVDIQIKTFATIITQQANRTADKLAQQGKTQAQIQTAVQTQVNQQLKTITNPAIKTKVQEQVKSAVAPVTRIKPSIAPAPIPAPIPTLPTTALPPTTAPPPTTVPPPTTAPPPITPPPKKPPPTKFPPAVKPPRFDRKEDNSRRRDIQRAKGAIAWRQGQLHGKNRWDVVMSPYTKDENYTIVLGRTPVGAIIVKGPRSAFKTARLIFGQRLKQNVLVNQPGIFSTELAPTGTKTIRLTFHRDAKITEKVGDLEKKGRIFPLP